jgi:polyphosphate kinase
MPRNIDHRVEVLFPLEGTDLIRHVRDEILAVYFADTLKGRQMKSDGTYARRTLPGGKRAVSSQERLLKAAVVGTK